MFKLIRKDKKKGFTLVELIVVIAILAVLALILVPAITGYVSKANKSKNEANARSVYTTAMLVNADEGPFENEADLKAAVVKFDPTLDDSELDNPKFTITLDDKTVKSVTYDGVTFDGQEFSEPSVDED